MAVKLSYIVPVYNVEKYLRKCVDSLLAQDYTDYEIILVDDGSTDNSPQICDEYVRAFEIGNCKLEIKCIHQKNGGLSVARNAGLKVAKGEYVCFVDSDDYVEPNVLKGLIEQVEREQLDVLRFDYQNVRLLKSEGVNELTNERYEVFQPYKHPHEIDRRDEVVDGISYLNERMGYRCYAWQWIIRREIVSKFTEGIHFEDVEWLPRMILKTKRIGSTQTIVYDYFWREGSITLTQGNKQKILKNLEDRLSIIARYRQYVEQYPNCKWLQNMQSSIVSGVLAEVARELYGERMEYISRLRAMDVFPLSIADQGKTYKRRAMLTNMLGAEWYCRMVHLIDRRK